LSKFRQTRVYDLLAASPLILFNSLAIGGLLIRMVQGIQNQTALSSLVATLNFLSLAAVMMFVGLQTVFLLIRKLPRQFSESIFSQALALVASNAGLSLVLLPHATISNLTQITSSLLVLVGASASTFVMIWLGKGFSVLPQARRLTMDGPYRFVRHPLYLSEMIITLGMTLQYRQPWATVLALAITAIQFPRMIYEERVLESVFPDYRPYIGRTARFLPGIF